jgi:hypothetical protein
MPEPKFKIGDYVYIAQEVKAYNENGLFYESYGVHKPPPFMIIGILQEECYAGTQIHYQFRAFGAQTTVWKMSEIELTDVPPIEKGKR